MRNKTNHTPLTRGSRLADAKLLLIITICVFVVMRDRQVVGELRGSDLNQSSIMKTIAGGEQA